MLNDDLAVKLQGIVMNETTSVRLDPAIVEDTEALLTGILIQFKVENRVTFLTAPGQGIRAMQRIRTKLSRVRNDLRRKGKPREYFLMQCSITPWTDLTGKRFDFVAVWKKKTETHYRIERFEDFTGTSESI